MPTPCRHRRPWAGSGPGLADPSSRPASAEERAGTRCTGLLLGLADGARRRGQGSEGAQEAAVGLVLPRHRTLAAPAGRGAARPGRGGSRCGRRRRTRRRGRRPARPPRAWPRPATTPGSARGRAVSGGVLAVRPSARRRGRRAAGSRGCRSRSAIRWRVTRGCRPSAGSRRPRRRARPCRPRPPCPTRAGRTLLVADLAVDLQHAVVVLRASSRRPAG